MSKLPCAAAILLAAVGITAGAAAPSQAQIAKPLTAQVIDPAPPDTVQARFRGSGPGLAVGLVGGAMLGAAIANSQPVYGFAPTAYVWGGHNFCWYNAGWNGPGWYQCGFGWRRGSGWGGPVGWNGWGRGPRHSMRGVRPGGHPGFNRPRNNRPGINRPGAGRPPMAGGNRPGGGRGNRGSRR